MAEGYKIGDVYKNVISFNKFEIVDITDTHIEVIVKDFEGNVLFESHKMQKVYFEEKMDKGVLTKVENVPCGTNDEKYKVGDIFRHNTSSFRYDIVDSYDEYFEVTIFDEHKQVINSNQIFRKDEFESRVNDGVLTKIETVSHGTVSGEVTFERMCDYLIPQKEMVNHPKHYNTGKYEVIDVIEDWNLNFALGNAVKYIARCEHKENKLQDLKKAVFYLQHEIDKIEKGGVQ